MIPLGTTVHFDLVTHDPETGGVADADAPPTFSVFEEASDTPLIEDQAMTKRAGLDGNYRGSFAASAGNGFEAGKFYNVVATGTVNSVTGKTVALTFRLSVAETVAGQQTVDARPLLDLAAGVESNRTLRQSLRLMLAALAGKLSGADTTTVAIRDTNDTKDRITATVTADGDRTAVTLDAD